MSLLRPNMVTIARKQQTGVSPTGEKRYEWVDLFANLPAFIEANVISPSAGRFEQAAGEAIVVGNHFLLVDGALDLQENDKATDEKGNVYRIALAQSYPGIMPTTQARMEKGGTFQ